MIWRAAVRDLSRHPARTGLALLGVAVATALLLDMVMLSGGIERSFTRLLESRGFELRVSPRGTLPFDTDATLTHVSGLLAAVRADPGVAEAGAVFGVSVFAEAGTSMVPLVVYGVTPEAQGIYQLERGRDLAPGDTGGVLIGSVAAQRLHRGTGDTVELVGRLDPRSIAASVRMAVAVRGTVRFIYDAKDQPSIAVTLTQAQRLAGPVPGADRASFLMIRAKPGVDGSALAARLQARFPDVTVSSIGDMVAQFRERLSYFRQLSLILGSIALVVTVLLIGTLLAITVNERIGDIAALRAIGVSRATVVAQIVVEGGWLTVIGGAAGTVFGVVTARWLDSILTSFPGLPAAISFFVPDPPALVRAGIVLIATGVAAGILPAWRAASLPIASVLRSDAL